MQLNKRMNYAQFVTALAACADARGVDAAALQHRIASCDGPIVHGTQAENVRFHDNRVLPVERRTLTATPPKSGRRPSWQDK